MQMLAKPFPIGRDAVDLAGQRGEDVDAPLAPYPLQAASERCFGKLMQLRSAQPVDLVDEAQAARLAEIGCACAARLTSS